MLDIHEIDASTVRRVAQGDVAALHELVVMYQDRVVALCYGVAGDRDEVAAHAVALEVFLLVFAHLKKLPGVGPTRMSTWILTIAAKRAVAAQHEQAALVPPAVDNDSPTAAMAAHTALLALPAHVLAERAWDALRATPEFVDHVLAAVFRKSAEAAALARAGSSTLGYLESSSVRRFSVVIALVTLAWFASAMLHSTDAPERPRPTPVESLNKGSASRLALPLAGPALLATAQPDLAAIHTDDQTPRDEIATLKAQVAQLQAEIDSAKYVEEDTGYPQTRPEVLRRWAAECHTRFDNLEVMQEAPVQLTHPSYGVTAAEIPDFNAAMREVHTKWLALVRAAYLEITGDAAGTSVLSPTAMIAEMNIKGGKNEVNDLRARIANERAGLVAAPAVDATMPAFERYYRAYANLGDTIEVALAKRIGGARARAARGHGWSNQTEASGCVP